MGMQQTLSIVDFKDSVDSWIKKINTDVDSLKHVPKIINENIDNTEHNYELITELKKELQFLREEVKTLKLIQTVMLKK